MKPIEFGKDPNGDVQSTQVLFSYVIFAVCHWLSCQVHVKFSSVLFSYVTQSDFHMSTSGGNFLSDVQLSIEQLDQMYFHDMYNRLYQSLWKHDIYNIPHRRSNLTNSRGIRGDLAGRASLATLALAQLLVESTALNGSKLVMGLDVLPLVLGKNCCAAIAELCNFMLKEKRKIQWISAWRIRHLPFLGSPPRSSSQIDGNETNIWYWWVMLQRSEDTLSYKTPL